MTNLDVRPPAVAGLFYPDDPAVLTHDVREYLAAAESRDLQPLQPKALIVPHAGYVYSAAIAASAYALLKPLRDRVRRVVLLGPAHRVPVRGLALPGAQAFRTPNGTVPIDAAAVESVKKLPQVTTNDAAHSLEHSLEVQLPFLQEMLNRFQLVPLAVGDISPGAVAEVIEQLWGGPETLIVISSDLSHYHTYDQARRIDTTTCDTIRTLGADLGHDQACGSIAINGLMRVARHRGLAVHQLDLRNSGDTSGDRRRVVGYAAFALTETRGHDG